MFWSIKMAPTLVFVILSEKSSLPVSKFGNGICTVTEATKLTMKIIIMIPK